MASYVTKSDSRVAGPWSSDDQPVPRQYRDITLRPWQDEIRRRCGEFEGRTINVLLDEKGGSGKSTLVGIMSCAKQCSQLPPLNSGRDVLRAVASRPIAHAYFLDLPRSFGPDHAKWSEFYAAIEMLKSGYAFDERYHYKEVRFDSPAIWIFCNTMPKLEYLTTDRWKIWRIAEDESRLRDVTERAILEARQTAYHNRRDAALGQRGAQAPTTVV